MDEEPDPEIPAKARRRKLGHLQGRSIGGLRPAAPHRAGAFLRRVGVYRSNIAE
jgi:hypothetical protein